MSLVPWVKHYLTPESPCRMWEVCVAVAFLRELRSHQLQSLFGRIAFSSAAQVKDVELAKPELPSS